MDQFIVTLPLTGEYLTTVRLTTGGLCALAGFDVDTAEDYKVCVTESLLILKRNGYTRADIVFTVAEALGFNVCGKDKTGKEEDNTENDDESKEESGGEVDTKKDENLGAENAAEGKKKE